MNISLFSSRKSKNLAFSYDRDNSAEDSGNSYDNNPCHTRQVQAVSEVDSLSLIRAINST